MDDKSTDAAFPEHRDGQRGMTLREWYAGQALVGLLAFPSADSEPQLRRDDAARVAYQYADAMLAAREMP